MTTGFVWWFNLFSIKWKTKRKLGWKCKTANLQSNVFMNLFTISKTLTVRTVLSQTREIKIREHPSPMRCGWHHLMTEGCHYFPIWFLWEMMRPTERNQLWSLRVCLYSFTTTGNASWFSSKDKENSLLNHTCMNTVLKMIFHSKLKSTSGCQFDIFFKEFKLP